MKTSLLSIQPVAGTYEFKVSLLIGEDIQQFTFTVEQPKQESFGIIGGDIHFCKFFRFNQHISAQVGDIIGQVYRGNPVKLPLDTGVFYTPDEAMNRQKYFRPIPSSIENQLPEKIRSQSRNRAIEIVDNLPESLLDELINVLESFSVKANNLK